MQIQEMDSILSEIGLSRAAFARVLGIDPHTVSRWQAVPKYAAAYLTLARSVQQSFQLVTAGKR